MSSCVSLIEMRKKGFVEKFGYEQKKVLHNC